MVIDLHTHTNFSDGTDTPTELINKALEKAQNVQISNFIDTLDEKNKEVVKSELKLQEDIATLNAAGFTNYENAFLANKLRIDAINKKYSDKKFYHSI